MLSFILKPMSKENTIIFLKFNTTEINYQYLLTCREESYIQRAIGQNDKYSRLKKMTENTIPRPIPLAAMTTKHGLRQRKTGLTGS